VDGNGWNMLSYSDIVNQTIIGTVAFGPQKVAGLSGTANVTLRVNGCDNGHQQQGLFGPPSTQVMIGSRGEYVVPNDDRFFRGHLGEVLIYNRTLSPSELVATEAYLAEKWRLANVTGKCPTPTCANMTSNQTAGYVRLQRFVSLLSNSTTTNASLLPHTYAFRQATLAIDYTQTWVDRCRLLATGRLAYMTNAAQLASVVAILTGVDSMLVGLAGIIGELPNTTAPNTVASIVRKAWAMSQT
jgi:hypothetical protein